MLISIKRYLDQRQSAASDSKDQNLTDALRHMACVLLDGMGAQAVPGRDADLRGLRAKLRMLEHQLVSPQPAMNLLVISSEALEALETYCQRTIAYFGDADALMRSMVVMLTETVAEISGHADSSVVRLQAIEKQLERASALDDRMEVRANLEQCLATLRETVAQQRKVSAQTVQKLQQQIGAARRQYAGETRGTGESGDAGRRPGQMMPAESEGGAEAAEATPNGAYVAVFKLQRADQIASRFGEPAKHQMLNLISRYLKAELGPSDRLLRWKDASFLMFITTALPLGEVQRQLAGMVSALGQQRVEVGRHSALLSIGLEWTLFSQARFPTLDGLFGEVDAFLGVTSSGAMSPVAMEC
jgi:hypothetical protein